MAVDQGAPTDTLVTGDVVRHEKIPHDLTVLEVFTDEHQAGCSWLDVEGYEHTGLFPIDELTKVYAKAPETPAPVADAIQPPSPSEVLYAFAGWLTSREERSGPFNRHNDAAQAATLVRRFCESQGYEAPRDDFPTRFKPYPAD
jgi:hypothetical protein